MLSKPSASSHAQATEERFPEAQPTTMGALLSGFCIFMSVMKVDCIGIGPSSSITNAAQLTESGIRALAYSSSERTSQ